MLIDKLEYDCYEKKCCSIPDKSLSSKENPEIKKRY
jgi:hypothetical protein